MKFPPLPLLYLLYEVLHCPLVVRDYMSEVVVIPNGFQEESLWISHELVYLYWVIDDLGRHNLILLYLLDFRLGFFSLERMARWACMLGPYLVSSGGVPL